MLRQYAAMVVLGFSVALWADTHTAASCNQADVLTAINAASVGDTVFVPAGTATWASQSLGCSGNSMLCVRNGIKLQGGVGGTTSITLSGTAPYGAICYEPDAQSISNNDTFEFSGFTIDGNNQPYGAGMLDVRNGGATAITKIKIHDNTFKNNRTEVIEINGPVYGVAYLNTFVNCETVIRVEGYDSKSWDLGHREYGTANSFFFEDNTIIAESAPSAGGFTAGQGGGIVVRYNTYDANKVVLDGGQWQDLHGLQSMTNAIAGVECGYSHLANSCLPNVKSCEQWSQVKTEWYGNIHTNFYNPYSTPQEWMRLRGSWMMMFNNVILGSGHMPLPDIYQYSCDSCQSDAGLKRRYSQHVQNTYVWNNIGQGEGNRPIYVLQDDCGSYAVGTPYTITENKDFWNYNDSCSGTAGCTRGIGIGTTAPTGACTPGVAFWVWSQGKNVPTTMAEMKTHTQAGKLYKCTAPNTWELYYQPYTYPHPLRAVNAAVNKALGHSFAAKTVTIHPTRIGLRVMLPQFIQSPELIIVDLTGSEVFRVKLSAVTRIDGAVYECAWRTPPAAGTYLAVIRELSKVVASGWFVVVG
jgi:hypothetical protein